MQTLTVKVCPLCHHRYEFRSKEPSVIKSLENENRFLLSYQEHLIRCWKETVDEILDDMHKVMDAYS